jgi:hypothetical protein
VTCCATECDPLQACHERGSPRRIRRLWMSPIGTTGPPAMSAIRSLPGVNRTWPERPDTVAIDPDVWSGRALQEGFVNLADAVLHQCIRPLIGVCCAPGHHGYQRAFELISGQASKGPFGSPVFACAGKTDPPSSSHPLADLGG